MLASQAIKKLGCIVYIQGLNSLSNICILHRNWILDFSCHFFLRYWSNFIVTYSKIYPASEYSTFVMAGESKDQLYHSPVSSLQSSVDLLAITSLCQLSPCSGISCIYSHPLNHVKYLFLSVHLDSIIKLFF